MPYIGNQNALAYTSFAKQDFTTSVTTSYTLDNPVANANEIALFINFVRQEPTTAYTASGTSLTLTSATSASDDMYCVFLGKALQTVNPPSGSVGLSQLSATGTKDATTFLRGDNTFSTISTGFTLDTAQTPTTNTASFTGIPSTARYIVLSISNLSFTGAGNTNFKVEIGDSGGLETTGYSNTVVYLSTNAGEASPGGTNYTDAFHFFYQPDQNNVWYGQIILSCLNPSTNTWVMQGNGATNSYCQFSAGTKSLSGTLTQLAVKTVNGANFDNGTLNIMYQ